MRNCLGVKCSRKAVHLDENQESAALKLLEKLSAKPYRKYAKVHQAPPPPLNPSESVKEAPPNQDQPHKLLLLSEKVDGDYASKSKSVRVVVTKKQLKQMLKNAEALKSMGISVQFADILAEKGQGSPRWRPSLSTIAE